MNRKKWFVNASAARLHVSGLLESGYEFAHRGNKPQIVDGQEGYGVQWYKGNEGKFFFLTTKRKVFIHWQSRDITNAENKRGRPLF